MSRIDRHDDRPVHRMDQCDVIYRCRCGWEGETFFAATSHMYATMDHKADETESTAPTPGDAA